VTTAEKQSLRRELLAPASVEAEPARLAKISPPLPGRIVRLFVHFGDAVKQGQPLFAMDSPELVAAQSDFLKARSAFSLSERNVARQKDLLEHGIGAARESELAQAERDTAQSELERATMRLRLLGMDPGKVGAPLTVTSPLAGRVIDLATAPGQFQNDPSVTLMTVADLTSVWVTADVQEKDIRRVAAGDEALVAFAAYPGETFSGSVLFVGDLLDAETRTTKVRVALPNPDLRLKPGMFATVTFKGKAADEVVVPTTAVVLSGERSMVYVETSEWTFEKRVVEVGDQIGARVVSGNAVLLP